MKAMLTRSKILVLASAFAFACPVVEAGSASGTITGYFTYDWPNTPPLLFVFISGTPSSPAACGSYTASSNRWVTRLDTPMGKAHMAVILAAKMTGRSVTVVGKDGVFPNGCDFWGDTESLRYVEMQD
jgi:hypothetical protein